MMTSYGLLLKHLPAVISACRLQIADGSVCKFEKVLMLEDLEVLCDFALTRSQSIFASSPQSRPHCDELCWHG